MPCENFGIGCTCERCNETLADLAGVELPARETPRHTPGPWKFDKEYGNAMDELYGPDGRAIAAIWTRGCDSPTRVRECYKPFAEGVANARLIAAAPDLLSACKDAETACDEVASWLESDEAFDITALVVDLRGVMRKLTAAIAKAEGN